MNDFEMTPAREAEIWRLVKAEVEAYDYANLEGEAYICYRLGGLQRRRRITSAELRHMCAAIEELLGEAPTLGQWVRRHTGKTYEQLRKVDRHLHNTRLAWLDWLIAQAEAHHE